MQRTFYYYQFINTMTDAPLSEAELRNLLGQLAVVSRNNATAYLDVGNNEVCRVWVDQAMDRYPNEIGRLKWGKTRKSGLPQIEGEGVFRPIDINVERGEGVNDLSHVMFLSRGVVGFEFNFYGPRINKLADYINRKLHLNIEAIPIAHPGVQEKLENIQMITKFELKVRSADLALLDVGNRRFRDAVNGLSEFSGCTDINFTLSIDPRTRVGMLERLRDFARRVANRADDDSSEIKTVKLSGRADPGDPALTQVDLLQEFILSRREVILEDETLRIVQSDSAYRAIEVGYRENLNYIQQTLRRVG
ncbi:hypothetical protein [Bdellovibrio sp. HCB-162]|uniref:hypothetical protein n=1 Tax=Bdellovibrio sp. HCB-162 TaxID=3394234 RepID=UPI0039BD58DA